METPGIIKTPRGWESPSVQGYYDFAKTPHNFALNDPEATWSTHCVETSDGRWLAAEVHGDRDGYPIIFMHGTPGSRLGLVPDEQFLKERGIKLITYDRPGYGLSAANPGRRPIDTVQDVQSIIRHFGSPSVFSAIGRSGGGPHTLSCAAELPGVERVAVLSSPAPRQRPELTEGLGQANTAAFSLPTILDHLVVRVRRMQQNPGKLFDLLWSDFTSDDERVLGHVAIELLATYRAGVRQGDAGWRADHLGLSDWGFDLTKITKPVLVCYGGQDPFTPPADGRWLVENIPTAQEQFEPHTSHLRSVEVTPAAIEWCLTGEYHAPASRPANIERPLLPAFKLLDKKGVQTVGLVVGQSGADEPGQIKICFDTLSPGNQARAEAIAAEDQTLPAAEQRLVLTQNRYGEREVILQVPLTGDCQTTEQRAKALADQFDEQPATWAELSREEVQQISLYPCGDTTATAAEVADATGTFLAPDGVFYAKEAQLLRALSEHSSGAAFAAAALACCNF